MKGLRECFMQRATVVVAAAVLCACSAIPNGQESDLALESGKGLMIFRVTENYVGLDTLEIVSGNSKVTYPLKAQTKGLGRSVIF